MLPWTIIPNSQNQRERMAGFTLGGSHTQRSNNDDEDEPQEIPAETLFQLYGTSSTASTAARGFELWQQQQQQQQIQRTHHHFFSSSGPTMLGFSSHDPHHHQLAGTSSSGGSRMRGSSSSGGGMSCQDCGNQAKKDCVHMRCRTCCKSRGFQCPTHVKSTWVPAAKRRERQQQLAAAATASLHQHPQQHQQLSSSHHREIVRLVEGSKRPGDLATTTTTVATTTSGEAVDFPAEVSSPTVFRCVKVSQMDHGEDEYAYQTAISIGGHIFRGILYDHGPESQYHGESSSMAATAGAIAAAPTAFSAAATASTVTAVAVASTGLLDHSSVYPTPLSAFMAGTQFFPHHPRP